MIRTFLLLIAVTWTASAHAQATPRNDSLNTPLRFRSVRSFRDASVRFRTAGDSAGWTLGKAARYSVDTYNVVDAIGRPLLVNPAVPRIIEVRAQSSEIRWDHAFSGAAVGAVVGASGVVLSALTCRNDHGDGPGCGLVIVLTPAAAVVGAAAGGLLGAALPAHGWHRVAVAH